MCAQIVYMWSYLKHNIIISEHIFSEYMCHIPFVFFGLVKQMLKDNSVCNTNIVLHQFLQKYFPCGFILIT